MSRQRLDVERLAKAIWRASNGDPEAAFDGGAVHRAERIAAEYEKLPVDPSGHPQSLATRPAPATPDA